MKQVLIIGKNSYIGKSLKTWLDNYPQQYSTDIVGARNGLWKNADFTKYEVVIDLAGIAHINNITKVMKPVFYSVNRDLSIEIAAWAKGHGIKYFVLFSSMNVYGDFCDNLSDRKNTNPTSFYGESKLQGDLGVQKLEDDEFNVAIIRPPFVYGKGCTGNYNIISKIAKKTPVFPTYRNKKSMIYIDNLCEFVRLVIENESKGVFTPQNRELISISELVREIAKSNNHKIIFTGLFNWMIKPMCFLTRQARKAFADDCYAVSISDYFGFRYSLVPFADSIRITESGNDK